MVLTTPMRFVLCGQVVHRLADLLEFLVEGLAVGVVGLIGKDRQVGKAGDGLQAKVRHFVRGPLPPAGREYVRRGSDLRIVSFWIRIFSVLVTTTLKLEPRMTGMSFSPSRVKVSFTDGGE